MISLKLTSTSEYALRAMSLISFLPKSQSLRAVAIAEKTRVPLHYLQKILRKLVKAGLVVSIKGHGGGFRLSRPPGRITYGTILEAMGYEKGLSDCVFGWGRCRESRPCPMHGSWSQLNRQFVAWAEDTTLAHILDYSREKGIADY
ncbi:MAG: Rrf2 family transcriptional regulator [Fibrobacteria bacterium]